MAEPNWSIRADRDLILASLSVGQYTLVDARPSDAQMKSLVEITDFFLGKFRAVAAFAPEGDREVTQSMVVHETALQNFAKAELAGQARTSLDEVLAELRFPLAVPVVKPPSP